MCVCVYTRFGMQPMPHTFIIKFFYLNPYTHAHTNIHNHFKWFFFSIGCVCASASASALYAMTKYVCSRIETQFVDELSFVWQYCCVTFGNLQQLPHKWNAHIPVYVYKYYYAKKEGERESAPSDSRKSRGRNIQWEKESKWKRYPSQVRI